MPDGRATVQTEDLLKVLFVITVLLLVVGTDPALGTPTVPDSLSGAFGL